MDCSISNLRGVWYIFIICIEMSLFNANSVDPDQMPHYVASDLGLHCLPKSFYGTQDMNVLIMCPHYMF